MSQRNTSQRPDKLRIRRQQNSTSSARREKQAVHPPLAGRGRRGGTRLAGVDATGASSSQTGQSQMVDPTQYQHEQHQSYQEEAYQPQYQVGYQPQYHEGYEPQYQEAYQYEQPPQQQYEQHPRQQAEPGMEDGGFPGGPYELSLLPNFGKHVAYKLWNDKVVSIIALFNLMIFYYLFY